MKKTTIIAFGATLALMTGCFEDEGNYDYKEPLTIEVGNVAESYTVTPGTDRLTISPTVTPADRKYDYFWTLTPAGATWGTKVDTLARTKDLDYPVNMSLGSYKLRFCAKDRATGIFAYTEYDLQVTTDMASGWWVLKTEGDSTDVDYFNDTKQKHDIIRGANGRHLAGAAVGLDFTSSYWTFDEKSQRDKRVEAVFLAAGKDLVVVDYFTGRILSDYDALFIDKPARREVKAIFQGPSDTHVVVDEQVYSMYHSKYDIYSQFLIKAGGQYDLSPLHHAAGTLPLLYNRRNTSFCSVQRSSTSLEYFKDGTPSPKNMGLDLLYIGGQTTQTWTQGDGALAVMKKQGAENYYLYTLNGQPYDTNSNPIQKVEDLDASMGLVKADLMALNQTNRIIYYVRDNKLYATNLDNKQETLQDVQPAPGEKVTYLEFIKFAPYSLDSLWFDYVAIATAKDGHYKLNLHPVAAGRLLPAAKTFEGTGTVKRIQYMYQSSYGIYTSTLF